MRKFTTDELVAQKPSAENFRRLKRNPVSFILHNIRSLENVGLFFRLADALLIEKIYLTGYTGYPPLTLSANPRPDPRESRVRQHADREINKTAIKLVPFVPWDHHEDINSLISQISPISQLVGVEQTDQSLDYRKAPYQFPLALLFGHERTGVENELLEKCDFVVHIPMLGLGNSHNVAMSAAIISSHILNTL
ncbi:MAG: tRNA/rRNA methyltransferase (SpoU) [Microgenomates group bacterium GW2011_GWA1_48_10]|uniref:tRNA/rRNA methyltransferase SpoU type domain-containing protein n=1 Tax=Candidatus Gottesmanbacteria bacterium RIFCSPHIGHO2_01_FULL_47_48 TaxID=1798381 RepID=A0A1F6A183_9BACT|nr:MAG: tRNA/rRNA methyltransferase (SpoU) [Microgenomates group bacterium GW2011_GWA1_48_10]OGG18440.1 MAG: hypothetical protein A2721_01480 [Candidatus Gottesmanbacteria bacterium RIFCSPHIGHO2_01_FULL_47_48]